MTCTDSSLCIFSCNSLALWAYWIMNKRIDEQGAAMSALTSQGGSTMRQLEESDERSADLIASTSDALGISFGHKMSSMTNALRPHKSSQGDTHKYIICNNTRHTIHFLCSTDLFYQLTGMLQLVNQLPAVRVTAVTDCLVLPKRAFLVLMKF